MPDQPRRTCYCCLAPPEPGRSSCAKHLKKTCDAVAKHRAGRKAAGLCYRCKEPAAAGSSFCQKHRAAESAVNRAWYARRKAAGLCRLCDLPSLPGKQVCEAHRESEAARWMSTYAESRAAGVCVDCHAEPAEPGMVRCRRCADAGRRRTLAYARKNRDRTRATYKRLYDGRKAAGVCVRCGKNPAPPDRTLCDACRGPRRRYVKRKTDPVTRNPGDSS